MIRSICSATTAASDKTNVHAVKFPMGHKGQRTPQFMGNCEPSLEDLLTDDIMIRLMARDGVAAEQLRQLAGYIPN